MEDNRNGDYKNPGFWYVVNRFFAHGLVRGIGVTLLTALIIWLATSLYTLPTQYAQSTALAKMQEMHLVDIKELDRKKLDVDVYEKRHQELKETWGNDIKSIKDSAKDNNDMLKALIRMHMSSKSKSESNN